MIDDDKVVVLLRRGMFSETLLKTAADVIEKLQNKNRLLQIESSELKKENKRLINCVMPENTVITKETVQKYTNALKLEGAKEFVQMLTKQMDNEFFAYDDMPYPKASKEDISRVLQDMINKFTNPSITISSTPSTPSTPSTSSINQI